MNNRRLPACARASGAVELLESRRLFAAALSIADARLVEPDNTPATLSFTISLSEPSASPISVTCSTADGSATAGSDYVAKSTDVTILAGATSAQFDVDVLGDLTVEDDETFLVNLSNPTGGGGATLANAQGTATIVDADSSTGILAIDDLFTVAPGSTTTLNVLLNDQLGANDPAAATVSLVTGATQGSASASGNSIVYTAPATAGALDTITLRVAAGSERSVSTLTVMTRGARSAPGDTDLAPQPLIVAGDDGNNRFSFRKRPGGQIQVLIDRQDAGTFALPERVIILGGAGDDVISGAGLKNASLQFFGGDGNDRLTGGKLADVLVGGPGDDTIVGGAGDDFIVGGAGHDKLTGATGKDTLVAGYTTLDGRLDALAKYAQGDVREDFQQFDDGTADDLSVVVADDTVAVNRALAGPYDNVRGKGVKPTTVFQDLDAWAADPNRINVELSPTVVGTTPKYIGYNQGYYLPGSSTSGWVDYSGVNAFRVWASPNDFEPANSSTFGDGIVTLADFEARKAAVRANPENNGFIPWAQYDDAFENHVITGNNTSTLNYMLGQFHDRGIEVLMQITRSNAYPFNGWDGAYEQWQHFYAMAYDAAKDYDVTHYQMYNEPDQSTSTITQDEWLQRLKLASDAVRSAIQDVDRDFGKSLVADISAPVVKLGAESVLTWDTPGSVDWGKQALISNRTDYAGRSVDYDVFNTYDLHRYEDSRPIDWYTRDGQILDANVAKYNASGQPMPYTYSEYNRRTTTGFDNRPEDTLDTPLDFSELAMINMLSTAQDVDGMYAFKFNQTDRNGSPQKTGFYYVSEEGNLDTTGATRGAEVQRLFARGFAGQRPRLATADSSDVFEGSLSFDPVTKNYSYYTTNVSDDKTVTATLDLSALDVSAGSLVTVEVVGPTQHGEVWETYTVLASKRIAITQEPRTVKLFTIPSSSAPQSTTVLTPVADAQVHNGDDATNGSALTAQVSRSAVDAVGDYAYYMKFDLSGVTLNDASRAIFKVNGPAAPTGSGRVAHVYAVTDNAWSESSITWANAPDLAGAADAKLTGVGTTATPVGELAQGGLSVDLSDYLRKHPKTTQLTLVIVREQRFTGDVDAAGDVFTFKTRESDDPPTLTVYST